MYSSDDESRNIGGMEYSGVRTNRGGCSILGFFIFVFLTTLLSLVFVMIILGSSSYRSWESDFELEADMENMIEINGLRADEVELIDQKIKKFQDSKAPVDYVEFSPREVAFLLGRSIQPALPTGGDLDTVYVRAYQREWIVYFKGSYEGLELPWIAFKVEKDNIESAKLEITSVYVGEWDLNDIGVEELSERVDQGYGEALVLVNESGLTGRRLDNIELNADSLIIKGRLNDL